VDIEALVKDAVWVGLAVGVIAMAIYMLVAYARYLLRPAATVAAATAAVPIGFQLP
jgi:hypothetical protein